MKIYAVRKDWTIIKTFNNLKEADEYDEDYFQIIYRNYSGGPIHIYKTKEDNN